MAMVRKGVGEILQDKGFITADQLKQALDVQKSAPGDLGSILMTLGFASERDVVEAKASEMGVPFIDLVKHKPEPSAVNVVPQANAERHKALPVKKDGNRLWVAMENPKNIMAVDDLRMVSKCLVQPMLAVPSDLADAMVKAYGIAPGGGGNDRPSTAIASPANTAGRQSIADLIGEIGKPTDDDDEKAGGDPDTEAAPVIRMANVVLTQAVEAGASDIHIEPDRRNVRVRFRVDGVLQEVMMIPKHIQPALISRYKIMADMNIAERRVPQDGRIPIKVNNKDYDLRVSCLPSMYGEKIVMRILDKGSVMLGLGKLGFRPEVQARMEELVVQPNGMFLVTGPTGSGKTTTLYSVLNKINTPEKNITTVEDPVEYQLSGITQVGINKKAGLNFSNSLRSFLRQDPDIIMVGEMRDLETADIAIEAALTGHLVLSTLHTNDAPSATMRLADMGVEPFLIAATVIGVLAQRLARKICSNCKEPYEAKASDLARFGFQSDNPDEVITLYRGKGCDVCRGSGYKGRLGIYELMVMNQEIAELVVRRATLGDIKAAALANGMKDMRADGLYKIQNGLTTPDEVMRVVFTAGF
ncbi:MAG: Flp pilus assembly complex ATPase component TadA [Armatimonadetes bacterium]|nr:Flp pilus assembly complex ATPase component TadA [Armatimonadota bacterium]